MKKNHSGFAALEAVIIVIVVVALAGAAWFVYQANKKNDKKGSTSQNTSAETSSSSNASDRELTITEWGVRASYNSKQKLTYKIDANTDIAYLSSQELTAMSDECAQSGGFIERYAPKDLTFADRSGPAAEDAAKTDSAFMHVGNYYYHFGHAQAGCGDIEKTQALQMQVNDLVRSIVPKLTAVQ